MLSGHMEDSAWQCRTMLNRDNVIQCRTMQPMLTRAYGRQCMTRQTNAGQSTWKTVEDKVHAEKQCSVRHAPAMQLLVVATAVAAAICHCCCSISAVFIVAVAALFMSGLQREGCEGEEDRNPIQPIGSPSLSQINWRIIRPELISPTTLSRASQIQIFLFVMFPLSVRCWIFFFFLCVFFSCQVLKFLYNL